LRRSSAKLIGQLESWPNQLAVAVDSSVVTGAGSVLWRWLISLCCTPSCSRPAVPKSSWLCPSRRVSARS
jgi:hypothetical protein